MNDVLKDKRERYSYYLFLIFLYYFVFNQIFVEYIAVLGYVDELLAFIAIPLFVSQQFFSDSNSIGIRWYNVFLLLFLMITALSSTINKIQPLFEAVLPDLFLNAKFWLALYVGRCGFSYLNYEVYGKKIVIHIQRIILILSLLVIEELITGGLVFGLAEYRYGLPAIKLFYGHPTGFCSVCVFLIMNLISLMEYTESGKFYLFILIALMLTTLRSKAVAASVIFLLIFYIIIIRKRKISLSHILLMIPIMIFIAWNQLYYYFVTVKDGSARYQLTTKAFQVAKDYFPLGSGFGTYGSYFSGKVYSPLYYTYRLSRIWGLTYSRHPFLSDTFWPMIIAQSGWIGTGFFLLALIFLFVSIQKVSDRSRYAYTALLCGYIYLLISSSAESAFVHPNAIPIAVLIGCLLEKRKGVEIEKCNRS